MKTLIMKKETFLTSLLFVAFACIPYFFIKYESVTYEKIRLAIAISFLTVAFFIQAITLLFYNMNKGIPWRGEMLIGGFSIIAIVALIVFTGADVLFLLQIADISDYHWQVKVSTGYIIFFFVMNFILRKMNSKEELKILNG